MGMTIDYLLFNYKYEFQDWFTDDEGNRRKIFVYSNDYDDFIKWLHRMELYTKYETSQKKDFKQMSLDL